MSLGPELATSGSDGFSSLLRLLAQLSQSLSIIDETAIPRHNPRFKARSQPEVEEKPNDFVDKFQFNCSTTYREDVLNRTLVEMEGLVIKFQSAALAQGLNRMQTNQEYFRNSFMNIATVAIFFSSIAASTLQFSYQNSAGSGPTWDAVNNLWFASLVLSIASATNGFLGATVYQSPDYLSRANNVEYHLLLLWFNTCPSLFLTLAGAMFLLGLCTFTFSSGQDSLTQLLTVLFTAANSTLLLLVYFMVFSPTFRTVVRKAPLFLEACVYVPFILIVLGWCILLDYVGYSLGMRWRPRWFYRALDIIGGLLDRLGMRTTVRRWLLRGHADSRIWLSLLLRVSDL